MLTKNCWTAPRNVCVMFCKPCSNHVSLIWKEHLFWESQWVTSGTSWNTWKSTGVAVPHKNVDVESFWLKATPHRLRIWFRVSYRERKRKWRSQRCVCETNELKQLIPARVPGNGNDTSLALVTWQHLTSISISLHFVRNNSSPFIIIAFRRYYGYLCLFRGNGIDKQFVRHEKFSNLPGWRRHTRRFYSLGHVWKNCQHPGCFKCFDSAPGGLLENQKLALNEQR